MAESKAVRKQSHSNRKAVTVVTSIAGAKVVCLTGDFSGWSEEGIEMSNGSGDVWKAELVLPPGQYQYRLLVDGQWQDHVEARERTPNPFGSVNCVLTVP